MHTASGINPGIATATPCYDKHEWFTSPALAASIRFVHPPGITYAEHEYQYFGNVPYTQAMLGWK